MSLRDSEIARAKEVPIVDILEKLNIPYKNVGGQLKIICAFHEEYDGSLTIYDDNHYHCYGCGEHGDGISLVRKLLDLSFTDAVEFINML